MDPKILLTASIASIIGAVALWMILRPGRTSIRALAGVVGLGMFGLLVSQVSVALLGEQVAPDALFMAFSAMAIIAAVCMITSARPVYSALYFVLVVLSSAALFLLLSAEFMAFALIIVYAGAILITYMFVLMLAQQASSSEEADAGGQAEYDTNPREPAAAAVIAFIMLALLSTMIYQGVGELPKGLSDTQVVAESWRKLDMIPRKRDEVLEKVAPGATLLFDEGEPSVLFHEDGQAFFLVLPEGTNQSIEVDLPDELIPSNVELVGLDLIAKFPVSLELAGVILLMAMFGAVILARKQIELGEDELRESVGMSRTSFDGSESAGGEA